MRACIVMCDGQGLDDDDARVIAENLNKFKRLKRLSLVGSGREGRGGREEEVGDGRKRANKQDKDTAVRKLREESGCHEPGRLPYVRSLA